MGVERSGERKEGMREIVEGEDEKEICRIVVLMQ